MWMAAAASGTGPGRPDPLRLPDAAGLRQHLEPVVLYEELSLDRWWCGCNEAGCIVCAEVRSEPSYDGTFLEYTADCTGASGWKKIGGPLPAGWSAGGIIHFAQSITRHRQPGQRFASTSRLMEPGRTRMGSTAAWACAIDSPEGREPRSRGLRSRPDRRQQRHRLAELQRAGLRQLPCALQEGDGCGLRRPVPRQPRVLLGCD
jgi:hypothetical protein